MRHFKQISTIITALLFTLTLYAQQGTLDRTDHGRYFPTAGRKIVVKGSNFETIEDVKTKLATHGAIVADDFFSRLFSPRVVLVHASQIDGSSAAYYIEVSKSRVQISYTSSAMLDAAILEFYGLFDEPYGQRQIKGANILYRQDVVAESTTKGNRTNLVDGVTSELSSQAVENKIKNEIRTSKNGNFILAVANRKVFRVDFAAFDKINPQMGSICSSWSYTTEEMRQFVRTAYDQGGSFVPAIDLLSKNDRFEKFTGHTMSSPEGMRFVRVIIEECSRVWGASKICIGRKQNINLNPKQYIDFINDIASREGLEIIIL